MRQLALRGSVRRWLTRLHRWSGFVIMVCLLIAGLTGIWLVFRQELDRIINSDVRVVEIAATRLSEDEIVSRVEAAFPTLSVTLVQFPQRPDESVWLSVSPQQRGAAPGFDRIYVDQYTGKILGQRSTRLGFTRASLDSLILGLHFQLLAGAWGTWIMGVAAFVWLLTNLIGLALSWPLLWLRVRSWIPILSTRTSSAYKVNYDLHRAGGVWLLPVLTVLALTSVALNLPRYFRPVVEFFSPLSQRPVGTRVQAGEAVVTFDQADAAVRSMFPEARTHNIYRDLRNGWHSVYFHLPEVPGSNGGNFGLVDLRTGKVTGVMRPARGSAGDRFMSWLFPLHTGGAFGWPGRLLVALAGIIIVVLNVTGLYTWYARWGLRRRARRLRRSPDVVR